MTYTTEKELRKEWKNSEKVAYLLDCPSMIDKADMMDIADWWLKHFEDYKAHLRSEALRICAEECNIANQEGVPTSRITSMANKLLALLE